MCLISTDLFTCESLGSGSNASITFDAEVSVGHGRKRSTQNHSSLCAEFSPKYNYLEIRFNHFYDVCAVTTWTKNSNHTLANFRIQYSNSMTFWPYYQQVRAIVKVSNYLSSPVGAAFINYHLCQAYANIPLGHVGSFESFFKFWNNNNKCYWVQLHHSVVTIVAFILSKCRQISHVFPN